MRESNASTPSAAGIFARPLNGQHGGKFPAMGLRGSINCSGPAVAGSTVRVGPVGLMIYSWFGIGVARNHVALI